PRRRPCRTSSLPYSAPALSRYRLSRTLFLSRSTRSARGRFCPRAPPRQRPGHLIHIGARSNERAPGCREKQQEALPFPSASFDLRPELRTAIPRDSPFLPHALRVRSGSYHSRARIQALWESFFLPAISAPARLLRSGNLHSDCLKQL